MAFVNDLFAFAFLQKALITSVAVGIIAGIIGSFIILRGMALMGDAISHAVLPGVAISYMLGINYFYGAVVFGILTALGIGAISQNSRIKTDSSIGIYFSYIKDLPSGPVIALAATVIFLIALIFAPKRGIIWSMFKKSKKIN